MSELSGVQVQVFRCFQVSLTSCPNIWSLLLIFGFLYWSSSWWWQSWQSVRDFYPLKRAFSHNPWAQLEFYENCGILWCCVEPQGSTGNSIFGLQTPKGGCHPMLYFKYQTTEKYCYARLSWHILVYDCGYVLVHGSSIDPIGFKILLKLARKFDLRLNYEHYPE